ncbi:NfeD domain-containing protein [Methanocaldococcus lauensis]|nr:NfeD domain-containing protein [Methanocaldococcus lauensis]
MEGLGYFFILVGFIVMALETVTPGLYLPALGIALLIYGVVLLILPQYAFISAIISGIITIILLNRFVYGVGKDIKIGAERFIGKIGKAVEDFDENGYGWVEIENQKWLAKSDDNIKNGDKVEIVGIEGVSLIVKKV